MIANTEHGRFPFRQRFDVNDTFGRRGRGIFAGVVNEIENNLLDDGDIDMNGGRKSFGC